MAGDELQADQRTIEYDEASSLSMPSASQQQRRHRPGRRCRSARRCRRRRRRSRRRGMRVHDGPARPVATRPSAQPVAGVQRVRRHVPACAEMPPATNTTGAPPGRPVRSSGVSGAGVAVASTASMLPRRTWSTSGRRLRARSQPLPGRGVSDGWDERCVRQGSRGLRWVRCHRIVRDAGRADARRRMRARGPRVATIFRWTPRSPQDLAPRGNRPRLRRAPSGCPGFLASVLSGPSMDGPVWARAWGVNRFIGIKRQ